MLPCSQPFSPQLGDWDPSALPWGTAPKDALPLLPQGQGCSHHGTTLAVRQGGCPGDMPLSLLWPCSCGWCRYNSFPSVFVLVIYMGTSGDHFGSPLQSTSLSGSSEGAVSPLRLYAHNSYCNRQSKNYPTDPHALLTPKVTSWQHEQTLQEAWSSC